MGVNNDYEWGDWEPTERKAINMFSIKTKETTNDKEKQPARRSLNSGLKPPYSSNKVQVSKVFNTSAILDQKTKTPYRIELEQLMNEQFVVVQARICKKSTMHVDNQFGGYKLRTMCLDRVALTTVRDGKPDKTVFTDHLWICEDTNTVVRDKATELGDIVIFKGFVEEYFYCSGTKQLAIKQYDNCFLNRTQKKRK